MDGKKWKARKDSARKQYVRLAIIGRVANLARSTRSRCVLRLAEWTELAHQTVLYDREVL